MSQDLSTFPNNYNVQDKACWNGLIDEPVSNQSFNCRLCLWVFESGSELEIHNYLEHMVITHARAKKIAEDTCTTQEHIASKPLISS